MMTMHLLQDVSLLYVIRGQPPPQGTLGTIMQDFGSASVMRSEQGNNPYANMDKARPVIREQGERIEFLFRTHTKCCP